MTDDTKKAEIKRRLGLLANLYIKTDEIEAALEDIHNLRTYGYRGRDENAYCYFVVGPSATGKSRLFSTYENSLHAQRDGDIWPVVRFSVPAAVRNVNEFLAAILRALGTEPFEKKHQKGDMEERILDKLDRKKVELILLEEANHFVDKKSGNLGYWSGDTIKTLLLDKAKVPVVLSGIEASEKLFHQNSQLITRRDGLLRLFAHDWNDEGQRERFQCAIELFEKACRFPKRVGLNEGTIAERIYRATNGVMGNLCRLFEKALKLGIEQGVDVIDQELLAVAHAKLADGGPGWKNVFKVPVIPPIEAPDESRVTKLHKQKRS